MDKMKVGWYVSGTLSVGWTVAGVLHTILDEPGGTAYQFPAIMGVLFLILTYVIGTRGRDGR